MTICWSEVAGYGWLDRNSDFRHLSERRIFIYVDGRGDFGTRVRKEEADV